MAWVLIFVCFVNLVCAAFDFELYHNLTAERLEAAGKRFDLLPQTKRHIDNKYARPGFGRVLTWNVKQLQNCQKNASLAPVLETACVILQSANVVALQNAENLDLNCLPCRLELDKEYEWPGRGDNEELKLLVRTKQYRSFNVKKFGQCESSSEISRNAKLENGAGVKSKRDMFGAKRDESTAAKKNLHYVVLTVKSDLNSGQTFILANVRMPLDKSLRRECIQKLLKDVQVVQIEENMQKSNLIMLGDFRIDKLEGSDETGKMYKYLKNLQLNGESLNMAISFLGKDPVSTLSGRRFDNILTNKHIGAIPKLIGPDFPLEPEAVSLPLTLQRLYNNYMVALYTSASGESDSVYECIKAYQIAGKQQLANVICKDAWVPSHYVSSYLPQSVTVTLEVKDRTIPVAVHISNWNVEGGNLRDRLADPSVRSCFLKYVRDKHVVVFSDFPLGDRLLDKEELKDSDIERVRLGEITTPYAVFVNADAKDGDTDMFILKKSDSKTAPDVEDGQGMMASIALVAPKLILDSVKLQPCLYLLSLASDEESIVKDIDRYVKAIDKDLAQRHDCDVHLLLAYLNVTEDFNLADVLYRKYKYINLPCKVKGQTDMYRYSRTEVNSMASFVVVLRKGSGVMVENCVNDLPGDEGRRGLGMISDFRELSTHYPVSLLLND